MEHCDDDRKCHVDLHGYIHCPPKDCCRLCTVPVVFSQGDAAAKVAEFQTYKAANPTHEIRQIYDGEAGVIVVFEYPCPDQPTPPANPQPNP